MDRIGSRRSRGNGSFQSDARQRHLSSKHRSGQSTRRAVRAWIESLEIRQLLSASDLVVPAFQGVPSYSLTVSASANGPTNSNPNASNNTASVTTKAELATQLNAKAKLASDLSVAITLPTQIIGNGDGEHPPVPVPVLVAGDDNALKFTVTNAGPSIAPNVQVRVPLPAGATFISAAGDSFQLQTINGTPTVVFTIRVMASGESRVETVTYHLDPSTARTSATQSATVSSDRVDPNPSNNTASETITISKPGDLAPTIFGPTVFRAGTIINYVLTVANDGDLNAGGGTVTFNIPANAPLVSVGVNNLEDVPTIPPGTTGPVTLELYPGLAPGQTQSISFFERIDPSVPDGGTVVPTAAVAPDNSDDDPSDNSTSLTTNVIAQADVSAAMTGPANITAGDNASYTITLTNNGPSDAQSVTFFDNLPVGMTLVSLSQTSGAPFSLLTPVPGAVGTESGTGMLPAGGSAVFQLVGMIASNVSAAPNAVTNSVTVSTSTAGDNPANNSASVTSNIVTSADLAVSLIVPVSLLPGSIYNDYQIVVHNNGPSDATSVVVESVLPASETYRTSLDQFNSKFTVISNGASGQTIIYSVADLPAGESDTIDIQSSLDPFAQPIPISNNASVNSATSDPDPTNNSASASVQVVTEADLSVDLLNESSSPAFLAGDTGEIEVGIMNNGPTYAQNVVVTDTLPQGASLVSITPRGNFNVINLPAAGSTGTISWTIPILPAMRGEGFDLVYQLSQASEVPGLTDSATVSSSTPDFNLSDKSAKLQLPTVEPAELIVNGPAVSRAGTFAQYGFTLDTEGQVPGWRVLTIDVPQGATISAISPPNGYVLPSGLIGTNGIIRFPINLPAEDNVAFVVTETTPSSTPDGTILTNSAWLNFDTSATQSVSTKIVAQADMSAKVTGPAAIVPGTSASYTLTVKNNGPSDAQNVGFTDALPPGMTFQSLTQTSGPAFTLNTLPVGSGGSISGSIATLPPGASATFILTGNAPSTLSATSLTDTLNVSTTINDLNLSNNSASVTTPVQPQADLGVSISTGVGQVVAGNGFTYTITLTNAGPSAAQNLVLSEVLAPGVAFNSFGLIVSGPYTSSAPHVGGNGTVSFFVSSMLPHASYSYAVNATVLPNAPAGPLPSTVTVSSSATDPNPANNSATDTITQATTSADVNITDAPPMMFIDHGTTNSPPVLHPVFVLGQNNTWVVDVTNSGPSDAHNVTWSSAIPTGVMFESVSQASGPVFTLTLPTSATAGTISGNIATLSAGQTAEFDLVFAQNGVTPGGHISSTATVTSDTSDPATGNNTSTGTALAYTPGDLAITVEGPSIFRAGTFISYIIDITNAGQLLAGGATVNFLIPDNAPLDSIAGTIGFPTLPNLAPGTTGPVSFTLPAGMVSGGDASISLRLFVEPNVPNGTILTPTATLTGTPASDDPSNNTSSSSTLIIAQGDLAVKQTGPSSILPGATATYTIKVTNNGPSDSQSVSFSDPLPTGMTFVSLTQNSGPTFTLNSPPVGTNGTVAGNIATLPSGASASFTLVTMLAPAANGGSLTNTVSASTSTTDPNSANNSASVTSTILPPQADLGVSLVGGTATAGSNMTYTLTVTNAGPSDAQNVLLTYALPAGTGFNSIIQTSGPSSSTGGPHIGGSGNAVASIPVLAAHSSATYQVSVTVFSSTPAGPLPSTLSVTSPTADTNLTNNTLTDTTSTVVTSADLQVTNKPPMMIVDAGSTTSPPVPKPAVVIGQDSTFVIDVTNAGPSDAQNVSWTNTVPTGLAFVSIVQALGPAFSLNISLPSVGAGTITGNIATLAPGQTAEFDVVYLANSVSPGATVASTVSITSDTPDANKNNNTATASATAYAPADLAVSVEGPSVFRAGTFITYLLDVTNVGGIPAGGATITYVIPSNAPLDSITGSNGFPTLPNPPAGTTGPITFTLPAGMVPGGGDASVAIREFILPSVPDGAILAPTATLSGLPASDNPSNNSSAGNTRVLAQGDLAVTQTGPAMAVPGTEVTYHFKITNNGPSDSQNVSFSDLLPADMVFDSLTQDSGPAFTLNPVQGQTANVTGNIASLPAGASASFTLTALLVSSASGTSRTNTVTTTSNTTDPNTANNAASVTSTISPQADLSVGIASGLAPAGGNMTYTLTVTNNGPSDAQNVVLTQSLPTGISYSSTTQSTGPTSSFGTDASGNVVINIATLPVGSFAIYHVHAAVASDAPLGPAPSTLSVTSTTTDNNQANNSVTDTQSPITPLADLNVAFVGSTKNSGQVVQGQNYTFTFKVVNNGPSDAQNVSWNTAVPPGLSLVSVTQDSGPAFSFNLPSGGTGTITGSVPTLPALQTAVFEVVYLAGGPLGQTVTSIIRATSDTPDSISGNNTLTITAPVYQPPPPADLAISLKAAAGPVGFYAGSYMTYTFDVANIGGTAAGAATVTYVIPGDAPFDTITDSSGFPTLPSVPAGTTGPITFTLPAGLLPGRDAHVTMRENISPSTPNNGVLTATATLSGLPSTDDPSNNTASDNTTVQTLADLAITQTGPSTVTAGAVASYQVTLTNNGFSDSQNVNFAETLPPGIDAQVAGIVQNSGPTFTLSASGGSIATLPAHASATFTISVSVGSDVTPGTVLTATATANSSTNDLNTSNDTAQTNTTVQAAQPSIIAMPTGFVSSVGPVSTASPILGFGRTIHTTLAGFSGVVAQFVDPTPTATSSASLHLHVAINWGDGSLSVGTVTYDKADGRWNVSGSHRYKMKGAYTITVIVQDSAGRQGTITSHAIVGPVLVTPLTKQLV